MEELLKIVVNSPAIQGMLVTGIGKAVAEILKKLPNPTEKIHLIVQPLYLLLSGAAALLDSWDKGTISQVASPESVTNFLNIYATTLAVHFGAKGVKSQLKKEEPKDGTK